MNYILFDYYSNKCINKNQLQNSRFAGIQDSGDRIQNKCKSLTTIKLSSVNIFESLTSVFCLQKRTFANDS
jgi:hypothetical protein